MKPDLRRGMWTRFLALLLVPGIPCFCWYALGGAGDAASGFRALAIVAYPLALFGIGAAAAALFLERWKGPRLWFAVVTAVGLVALWLSLRA